MFFFISYYFIRSIIGTTYWVVSNSYYGIRYLIIHNKDIGNKTKKLLLKDKDKLTE